MVLEFVVGFLLVVAATYVGATMALRGFFGHEYDDPRTGDRVDDADRTDD